ncbi:MAG: guanylate kinase [Acidobacteria bacterium]|nr:guanylate kinase [Acidobacteriota bacterium]
MSSNRRTIILIGPGGVGKGTLARRLVERDEHLVLSRSWTTRPPRPHESEADYHFVDRATFEAAARAGQFYEWAEFQGQLYGTPRPDPSDSRDLLLEIDVQGAEQILAQDSEAVVILVLPPSPEVLEARLRGRGDDESHVRRRLEVAAGEIDRGRLIRSAEVVNDDLERATSQIFSILEGLRR